VNKRLYYKKMKKEVSDTHLKEVYDNRQIALKWILVTCFGYLGYKNAKFGTVDGHIGVCAFGREALLNASRTAEKQGFEVIHGIVDSPWDKKPDARLEDYENLCKAITKQTGISISFEGRYKWIVFLPSRMHPRIGVLNRYYGVMEDGKIKMRGLEIRRRDTPRFVFEAQTKMIDTMATANNTAELRKQIPLALNVVRKYRQKLVEGDVPVEDLIITKRMSKRPDRYRQHVSQVIAAEQLIKEGTEVHAGNSVRFLFIHSKDKRHERRVKAAQLIEKGVEPDTVKYLMLLYSSAANLLSFEGYTINSIYDAIREQRQRTLKDFSIA